MCKTMGGSRKGSQTQQTTMDRYSRGHLNSTENNRQIKQRTIRCNRQQWVNETEHTIDTMGKRRPQQKKMSE